MFTNYDIVGINKELLCDNMLLIDTSTQFIIIDMNTYTKKVLIEGIKNQACPCMGYSI